MYYWFAFIGFWLLTFPGYTQLVPLQQASVRLVNYAQRADYHLGRQQPDSAWQYGLEPGARLLRQLPDTDPAVRRFRYELAKYYHKVGQSNKAIWQLKQLLAISPPSDPEGLQANMRYSLAAMYSDRGQYQACITQTLDNLPLLIAQRDHLQMAKAYMMLSWVYEQQQDTPQMDKYALLGIRYARLANLPELKLVATINEAEFNKRKARYDPAIKLFKNALAMIDQLRRTDGSVLNYRPDIYKELTEAYLNTNRLNEAQLAGELGLTYCQTKSGRAPAASIYATLSAVYARQGRKQASLKAAQLANGMANQSGMAIVRRRALEQLSLALERTGQQAEALRTARQLASLTDSLNRINKAEAIAAAEARFDVQQKNATIGLLNKNMALRQQQTRQEKQIAWLIIALLTIGIGAAVISWYRARQTGRLLRRQKAEIEQQATELANLNQFKDQLFSIVSHDLRGPLVSLLHNLDVLDRTPPAGWPEAVARVRRPATTLMALVDNLLYWAIGQLKGLRTRQTPFNLSDSVSDVLTLYADTIQQKQLQVRQLLENSPALAEDTQLVADENQTEIVLRNVIQNAIKFSPVGGTLTLQTERDTDQLTLLVGDEGPGFDWKPNATNQPIGKTRPSQTSTGLGLLVVEELMQHNGGKLAITKRPNAPGTLVKLTWKV